MGSRHSQPGAPGPFGEDRDGGRPGRDGAGGGPSPRAPFRWLRGIEPGAETAEQRIETSLRILFDLDGSRDASRDAARVLRMARRGETRAAILAQLLKAQARLQNRADYETCARLADIVLQLAGSTGRTENV